MNLISFFPTRTAVRRPITTSDALGGLFDEFFNQSLPLPVKNGWSHKSPAVNVAESNDTYRIEVAAPGLAKEDFEVKVENEMLTISAKKETAEASKEEKYTRKEFNYYEFARSFYLPETVDAGSIKARYENGVLNVVLSKKPEAKQVPVKLIDIN